jgi:hypothetical protein
MIARPGIVGTVVALNGIRHSLLYLLRQGTSVPGQLSRQFGILSRPKGRLERARLLANGMGRPIRFDDGAIVKRGTVRQQLPLIVAFKNVDNRHAHQVAHLKRMCPTGLWSGRGVRSLFRTARRTAAIRTAARWWWCRHDNGSKFIHPRPNNAMGRRDAIPTARNGHDSQARRID